MYEDGDSLFLFGFSRGAYTARSLAGMIVACGLPTQNFADDMVDTVFDAYRDKDKRADLPNKLANCKLVIPDITMVGVWDTVGSLGIPSAIGAVDAARTVAGPSFPGHAGPRKRRLDHTS